MSVARTIPYVQHPATLWVPERKGTFGDIANHFGEEYGIPRDAEQRRDIDVTMSFGPGGRWLTLETAIIEGRQNGKTKSVLMTCTLTDFFILSAKTPDRFIWTSHLMKTTLDSFEYIKSLIDNYDGLRRRVKEISESKSEIYIQLMNGSQLDFLARSGGGGRGLSGRRLVFDEALYLSAQGMGALIPTLSSRDNPQINYGSSAGLADSDHLRSIQRRGRRGGDPSLIFIEYRAPGSWDEPTCARGTSCTHLHGDDSNLIEKCGCGSPEHRHDPALFVPTGEFDGCAMDDPVNWKFANHAIGAGHMHEWFVEAESRSLRQTPAGVLEFGRERMGWEELGADVVDPDKITRAQWEKQRDPLSEIVGEVVFAIDQTPSGSHTAICVAGWREDGSIHMGVVAHGRGNGWVVDRLKELTDRHDTICGVKWQPQGNAIGGLRHGLKQAGINVEEVSLTEYADACSAFKNRISDGTLWHQGSEVLDTAFSNAIRVVLPEGGWRWGRKKSSGDISPMVAATLAVMGVEENGDANPSVLIF